MVPLRFSSANRRIVIMGMKNSPITLMLESRGRTICSLRFIGNCSPSIWVSMAIFTIIAHGVPEEEAENDGKHDQQNIGDR